MSKNGVLSKITTATISSIAAIIAFALNIGLEELLYTPIKIMLELIGRSKKDIIIPDMTASFIGAFLSLWIVLWLIKRAEPKQSFRIYVIITITSLAIGTFYDVGIAASKPEPYHFFIAQFIIIAASGLAIFIGAYAAAVTIEEKRESYEIYHSYTPIDYEYKPSCNPVNEEDEKTKEEPFDELRKMLEKISEEPKKQETENTERGSV